MPQIINTNVMSLNAQRNLNTSGSGLATALQRLSSGMRINSAKDDAAGLAISNRMTAQVRGLNQASRNANDGISLAQTAEGAMGTITNSLQRIRELSIQSANATNSASDRTALQTEAAQLIAEIDRVASTTSFNNVNLLDGTFTSQQFQVGANANQTITLSSISSARTSALGQSYSSTATGTAVGGALATGDLLVNGVDVGATTRDAAVMATAINNQSGTTGVTATAASLTVAGSAMTGAAGTGTFTINGVTSATATVSANEVTSRADVVSKINAISAASGVTAVDTGSVVNLVASDGATITHSMTQASGSFIAATTGIATATTTYSTISLTGTGTQGINLTGAAETDAGFADGLTVTASLGGTAVSNVDISSVNGANAAITSMDAALDTINSSRATLGAIQSRFESVTANLAVTAENLSTARSRIQDADFAAETAALTRTQILQQAGISILSQANSQPQLVLSLLQ